ncbi:hypothetical protein BSLG_005455 [Batrachochytrium salamandrivorans]|nr:hypothetical protein BSLG_005455 [Batrachochytrium salamandrivorans]
MPLLSRSPSVQHIQTGASPPTEEAVWERYRKGDQVGRGVYGIVYRAVDASSGSVVAVKRTPMEEEGVGSTTLREACILSRDNHRTNPSSKARRQSRHRKTVGAENVVQMRTVFQDTSHRHLFFIMDYAETDLAKHMKVHRRELGIQVDELSYTPTRDLQQMQQVQQVQQVPFRTKQPHQHFGLAPDIIRSCMRQILSGLSYAHGHKLTHRDLKPSNILINYSRPGDPTSELQVKIADFGLARIRLFPDRRHYTPETITMLYRAPEVFFGLREYGSAVDIWSCGCIFAELARGQPLFDGESEIGLLQDIQSPGDVDGTKHSVLPFSKKVSITPLNNLVPLSSPGIDLLKSMLAHKSSTRIRSQLALRHSYFNIKQEIEE